MDAVSLAGVVDGFGGDLVRNLTGKEAGKRDHGGVLSRGI